MKSNRNLVLFFILVLVAVGSFFLGRLTSAGKPGVLVNRRPGGLAANGQRQFAERVAGQAGANAVVGRLTKLDGNQLVVTLPDGGSRLAIISAETVVTKMASGTVSDLTVGQNVMINGSEEGGTVIAKTLQIRPNEPKIQR